MKLKDQISKDYMIALREKNVLSKNLLSVIKGEIQTVEKNTGVDSMSDEDVLKIITKTAKSLKETISLSDSNDAKLELAILEVYLPKLMSKEEVVVKVTELVNSGINQIGPIMKEFAQLPADKKMVSEVIREIVK